MAEWKLAEGPGTGERLSGGPVPVSTKRSLSPRPSPSPASSLTTITVGCLPSFPVPRYRLFTPSLGHFISKVII